MKTYPEGKDERADEGAQGEAALAWKDDVYDATQQIWLCLCQRSTVFDQYMELGMTRRLTTVSRKSSSNAITITAALVWAPGPGPGIGGLCKPTCASPRPKVARLHVAARSSSHYDNERWISYCHTATRNRTRLALPGSTAVIARCPDQVRVIGPLPVNLKVKSLTCL